MIERKMINPFPIPAVLSLFRFAAALRLFGFGTLVGIVYPLFGYASIPLFAILIRNYVRVREASRNR